jgi:hypothetical protein
MFVKFESIVEAKAAGTFVWYWIGDEGFYCGGSFGEVMANLPEDTTFMLYGEWKLNGHSYDFDYSGEVPEFYSPMSEREAHIRARDFYAPYKESDGESRMIAGELGISFEEYRGIYVSFEEDF